MASICTYEYVLVYARVPVLDGSYRHKRVEKQICFSMIKRKVEIAPFVAAAAAAAACLPACSFRVAV